MRALRLYGYKDVRLEEIPEPICKPGTVKIRPRFNGLCGSDLMAYFTKGTPMIGFTHPISGEKPPVGFGHEFSGEVTEVGEGVSSLQVGDKVAVNPILHDGTCDGCSRGFPNCCDQRGFIGLHGGGGGLSDAIVVKESMAFKLPADMDLEVGALVEPLAVGWHGVGAARDLSSDSVALVLGAGPVGCAIVLALIAKGVKRIVVSEPLEARASIARKLGAMHVFDPVVDSVDEKVMECSSGRGADFVFECSGAPVAFETACKAVRVRGQIVNLAVWSAPISFMLAPGPLMFKEVSMVALMAYKPEDFQAVIDALASGVIDAKAMVTKRIPLDKLVEEGLETLREPKIGHCKILVDLFMK